MISQMEMAFGGEREEEEEVRRMMGILARERRWMKADELVEWLGEKVTEGKRRWVRRLAELSNGVIISGQQGYRHIEHATAEEINHAAAWLEHQAKTMGERAGRIRARAHERVG